MDPTLALFIGRSSACLSKKWFCFLLSPLAQNSWKMDSLSVSLNIVEHLKGHFSVGLQGAFNPFPATCFPLDEV